MVKDFQPCPDDHPQTTDQKRLTSDVLNLEELQSFCEAIAPKLYGFFLKETENNYAEAEDLTIKALSDFVQAIKRNNGTSNKDALIWTIADRRRWDFRRRESRFRETIDLEDIVDQYREGGSFRPVEKQIIDMQDQEDVLHAIKKLHPLEQVVLVKRMLGYTFSEIAKMNEVIAKMDKPIEEKTIRNRYNIAIEETLPRLLGVPKKTKSLKRIGRK